MIDYIFRDLAISYLKRSDLGQVKPEDLLTTGTKGELDGGEARQILSGKQSAGFKTNSPTASNAASGGALPGGILPGGQKPAGLSGPASGETASPGFTSQGDSGRGTVKGSAGGAPGHNPHSGAAIPVQAAVMQQSAMQPQIQVLDQPPTRTERDG